MENVETASKERLFFYHSKNKESARMAEDNSEQLLHYDWKAVTRKVSMSALRRGKPGRILNAVITKEDIHARMPKDDSEEFLSNKEKLMADILEAMPGTILDKLEDKLNQYIAGSNILELWKTLIELHEAELTEAVERLHRQTKRTPWQLFVSTISGEYIEYSWAKTTEGGDLSSDVVNLNGSIALVSALVLTM